MKASLMNVHTREVVCNCESHLGETVQQIEAQLPNGKPIIILKDWAGLHVSIGARNAIGLPSCPPPVTEAEAERMIQEAMQI